MINATVLNGAQINGGVSGSGATSGGIGVIPVIVFTVPSGPVQSASVFRTVKQPAETLTYGFDFSEFLPSGVSIVSTAVSVATGDGALTVDSTVVDLVEDMVVVTISGGTNRKTYKVELLTNLSNGDKVQDELFIYVKDY